MIDNFDPQPQGEQDSNWTPLPFAAPLPDFSRLEKKYKKRKKSKRGKKRNSSKKAQRLRLEAERAKLIWENGYLTRQNEMWKYMVMLAVAADRRRVNTELVDNGVKLISKGGRQ